MGGFFNRFDATKTSVTATSVTSDDLEIDSGTLSIDATNNKVGVGLTAPKTKLTVEGAITLKEQADADSDTADYGQIWVNTATPNELYFTTDAGNDIQLTSGTSVVGPASAVSMSNGSDNRVTTATGAAALNGEANLTFDGTTLAVNTDVTATTNHTTIGSQIDYDATGIIASGQTGQNIGLDVDINSDSPTMVGTVVNYGIDVDVVGGTSGTQTCVGIDTSASGGDFNYGGIFTGSSADIVVGASGTADACNISARTHTSGTTVGKNLTVQAGSAVTGGSSNINGGDLILKSGSGDGTGTSSMQFYTKVSGTDGAAERMRIHTNGYVGIGENSPAAALSVAHTDDTEDAVTITGDSLTTGSLLKLTSDSSSTGNRTLLTVHNDNTAAVGVQMVHLLNDAVGGDGDPIMLVESSAAETEAILELRNSNTATDKPSLLRFYRTQWNEADDMSLGSVSFQAVDSTNTKTEYATIDVIATDITDGDEAGKITFNVFAGGTAGTAAAANLFSIGGEDVANTAQCEVVVNEAGINCDFRVEGDSSTNLLYVDASAEAVIINGTQDHAASFVVDGSAAAIALKEMAAAPADTAAYGQLWVKNTTPNQLWFTDDAGTDTQLGAGGGGSAADDLNLVLHMQVFS